MNGFAINFMTFLGRGSLLVMLFYMQIQTASAELILTAPPREKPDAGKQLYGPLANRLSKVLKEKVTYVHPGNWLAYQRDMRNDKFDIIFDGPHFISWRAKNRGHTPIVKLPGHLQFVMVTKPDNDKINTPDDLIGRKLCGVPPPNLATLSAYDYYKYPARQPVVIPVRGGPKKVYKALLQGRCEAAVLPTFFVRKFIKKKKKHKVKIIYTSIKVTNQGISVSSRVKSSKQRIIIKALTTGKLIPATKGILKRFGGKAKAFLPVKSGDYADYNKFIEGVIFGW